MRHKISITIDEDTLSGVREMIRYKSYRNRSHFFEIAASKLIEEVGQNE